MKSIIITALFVPFMFVNAQDFNNAKNMESKSHQARINILKDVENCIQNAKTKEEYQFCEKMEKEQRLNFQKTHFSEIKESVSKRIEKEEERLKTKKECVNRANSTEELKNCYQRKTF